MEFNIKDKVEYIIALVNEFARAHKLSDSMKLYHGSYTIKVPDTFMTFLKKK